MTKAELVSEIADKAGLTHRFDPLYRGYAWGARLAAPAA